MEAFSLMQKDPGQAKKKYANDPEVTHFLTEFSKLMATHFEVLGSQAPSPSSAGIPPQATPQLIDDPKVEAALKDPEVQQLISELQRGRQLEMHELGATNPRLFQKIRVLLDSGLLNVQ